MFNAKFVSVNPVIPVKDVKKAIEYYVAKLGFKLLFQDSDRDPKYAGIQRDSVELHLQWHDESEFAQQVEKLNLRFIIDDVDKLFHEYQSKRVFQDHTSLHDTPWGTREFAFFDPDNNGLTFYRDL